MQADSSFARRFFTIITAKPKTVIVLGLLIIIAFAVFIPGIHKDTRSDAFIPQDHPALQFRERTRELFGLEDPMVIALVNEGKNGIFNPHSLYLLEWLTTHISEIPQIDPDRVTSLATENNIVGTDDGMQVEPFFEQPPSTQAEADDIRASVMDFPLLLGNLVARDDSGTLLIAELHDQNQSQQVYQQLLKLIEQAPLAAGEHIHVAGEGAVSGYMGAYIDADATRLDPIAAIVISLICLLTFRTLRGMMLPNLVVLATAAGALGLMAAAGVSFFVITNALPIVLIGIAVADSIHILSEYYQRMVEHTEPDSRTLAIESMVSIWKPITLTSMTTMAGFLGLSLASVMPPMKYFGLFALIGVGIAWIYSLTVIPAILSMLKLTPSPAYRKGSSVDIFGIVLSKLGLMVVRFPKTILLLALMIMIIGGIGASRIKLDETLIRTFDPQEPLFIADSVLNRLFDGSHYLDILIETPEAEALFLPENLRHIEALQVFLETLPHVQGSTSIVDYLKQMNRALNEGRSEAYQLPDSADLAAQYFLLYSTSAGPDDFQQEIDYDYRQANIRVRLNDGRYSAKKTVIEAAQQYLDAHFNNQLISGRLSGRVNVDYHWIKRLGDSHYNSIGISLLLVWLMASLSFRSLYAGLMALFPVIVTILMIYAVMGFNSIWLSISSSMFAAIAIGLGVDFSIHTLEKIQTLMRTHLLSIDQAILKIYPTTGRALFFNFASLALGFGVLYSSKVIILQEFGLLVAVSIATSFLTSMTVLPALLKVIKPRFLINDEINHQSFSKFTPGEQP